MNDLLVPLTDATRAFTSWIVSANLSTLFLLAAAIVLDLLLARRLSPAWRAAFYFPVFLRVLVPAHISWTVPFWKLAASAAASIVPGAAAAAPSMSSASASDAHPVPHALQLAALGVYLLGLLALATRWVLAELRLRAIIRRSRATPTDPTLLLSDSSGPMVVGVHSPRIIVPAWLTASDAFPLILAHERAHIARRDPALAFLLRLFCTFAWPIVPLWLAASRIRALMEQACDDHALGNPASRNQETVMKYARTMIDIAHAAKPLAGSLAFGAALRSRIKALRVTRRWPAAVQCGAALALPVTLFACSTARPTPAELSPGVLSAETNAPAQLDQRTVFARVALGEMPMPEWEGTTSNAVFIDRAKLMDRGNWWDTLRIDAAPTLLVEVGQAAEVRSGDGVTSYTLDVTVHVSAPDTIIATISFSEGSSYMLPPQLLEWKKGQTCVIRVPSVIFAQSPRTLIIDVLFPGEDPGC